ncbi:hypothetical protein DKX38_003968 [Salix brachista]|uniref:WHY domain class transcription factor n=1 Tax=Salix brachista TaxID=2182728 RepID=A0A5N5N924_9ROSI|nr:hypothetical protein DKX38_003968 [Salix brachista]
MMKLSRFLNSNRNALGKATDVPRHPCKWFPRCLASLNTMSCYATKTEKFADRVFAPYSVFKGKAALSVEPVLPTFSKFGSGNLKVDRRGSMMLTFLPAIGERKYDHEKRQKFALSATEVGSLLSMGPKDSCEFFHDPSMLSSNAGQVRKNLSIKPHSDGSGYFISLSVANNILKTAERFTVPVTTAEFTVLKTACSFALPHIMGWDRLTTPVPGTLASKLSKVDPQMPDLEWDK